MKIVFLFHSANILALFLFFVYKLRIYQRYFLNTDIKILRRSTNLKFIATENHPFLVRTVSRKHRSPYRKLSEGTEWVSAGNLIPYQHYLGIPINKKQNPVYFKEYKGYSFWWLIGRYLGDGWTEEVVRSDHNNFAEKRVIICCGKKNPSDLIDIEKHLKLTGFKYRISECSTTYKFYIQDSKELHDWLQQFGKYAYGKRIPGKILDMPLEDCEALLDGYLSADGYFNKEKGMYQVKTVSKELYYGLIELVNKVYKSPCSNNYIHAAGTNLIEGRQVNRKEKYSMSFYPNRRTRSHYFIDNDFIWVPVRKVEKIYEKRDVYNIGVYDINTYVAGTYAVHNCGVLITPSPVVDFMPQVMIKDKDTKEYVATTQLTMTECEDAGCLKMDFLGLRNLGVISEEIGEINSNPYAIQRALKMIQNDPSKNYVSPETVKMLEDGHISFRNIPKDDFRVYKYLSKGNTQGVFQYESPYMRGLCQELLQDIDTNPSLNGSACFNRLSDGSALGRPGPMAEIPNYINSMLHPEKIHYEVDKMKDFLSSTYGIIVYQEQAMTMVRKLAGFSAGQADLIRKGMAYC